VVATSAIRDEGTSYHYLAPNAMVDAPANLAAKLFAGLQGLGLPIAEGPVWTTDAPYRETKESLREHAANGALAVEMQAASLFAFAQARHAEVGIVAHVTNASDYTGEAFDKGPEEHGWQIVQAMCRACLGAPP
jgi:uridine phosphorylase